MDNNTNNKQNRSMFLYTALIFVVALLLIIIAFFGQKNISDSHKNIDDAIESISAEPMPSETVSENIETLPTTAPPAQDDYAKLLNDANLLSEKNKELSSKISVYELLLSANTAISEGDFETAKSKLTEISIDSLTEDQKILYNQLTEKTNE